MCSYRSGRRVYSRFPRPFITAVAFSLFCFMHAEAQLPEDALRLSWINTSGSARHQAIGGAIAALGGDITAGFINPAGLGLFKTNEFIFSPGFQSLQSKGAFRGTDARASGMSRLHYGTSGLVIGYKGLRNKWTSNAFSIALNKTASFDNTLYYQGKNDYSTFAEPLADEFASSGLTIDQALNSPSLSMLTKMALYTYLVDTARVNGLTQVIARSEAAAAVNQQNIITSKGGVHELALSFASNMDDKLYLGLSLGIPIVRYTRTTQWQEEDADGKGNNEFAYSQYTETYSSNGLGLNAKLGLLFKPADRFRIGLAFHTPTLYGLRDKIDASMTTDIDTARGTVKVFTVNATDLYKGQPPSYQYDLVSPWRIIAGGAFVINEVADVAKQKGFITADVEYVGYGSSRFSSAETNAPNDVYKDLNTAVKNTYKGTFNFRAGGELKFNLLMARLGVAYLGNPYKDPALKGSRMNLSGGIGYRNKGYVVDLTYVHSIQKNVHFPYRVAPPRLNTFANLRDQGSAVVLTLGMKF